MSNGYASQVHLCKADVEFDLEELETAAKIVLLEEESSKNVVTARKAESLHCPSSDQSLCKEIATLSLTEKK